MKFYDKYPKLKEREFLTKVLTGTVFSTMALENQEVSKQKIKEIISSVLHEKELKGNQFFTNKSR